MLRTPLWLVFALPLALLVAACGGGGGASVAPSGSSRPAATIPDTEEPTPTDEATEEPSQEATEEPAATDGGTGDEDEPVITHTKLVVTSPDALTGTYEADTRGGVCAFGMQSDTDFYANPSVYTGDGSDPKTTWSITVSVNDASAPERTDLLFTFGNVAEPGHNFYVDENNGSATATVDDQGETARFTATGEAVELLDPNSDRLGYTLEIDCRQIERY